MTGGSARVHCRRGRGTNGSRRSQADVAAITRRALSWCGADADYPLWRCLLLVDRAAPPRCRREPCINRMDIAYLFYLPFSQVLVSSDKLHRKCAPLFLRHDQHFVWGIDLKADLGKLNSHYLTLPGSEQEQGIMAFAHLPPKDGDFLTARIYDRFGEHWRF
jgi:hypothetical protein